MGKLSSFVQIADKSTSRVQLLETVKQTVEDVTNKKIQGSVQDITNKVLVAAITEAVKHRQLIELEAKEAAEKAEAAHKKKAHVREDDIDIQFVGGTKEELTRTAADDLSLAEIFRKKTNFRTARHY